MSVVLKNMFNKTHYLVIGNNGRDLNLEGNIFKNVNEYKYLQTIIWRKRNNEREITHRINKGK